MEEQSPKGSTRSEVHPFPVRQPRVDGDATEAVLHGTVEEQSNTSSGREEEESSPRGTAESEVNSFPVHESRARDEDDDDDNLQRDVNPHDKQSTREPSVTEEEVSCRRPSTENGEELFCETSPEEEEREKASFTETSGEREELGEISSTDDAKDEADSPLNQSSTGNVAATKAKLHREFLSHQSQNPEEHLSNVKKSGDTNIFNSQVRKAFVNESKLISSANGERDELRETSSIDDEIDSPLNQSSNATELSCEKEEREQEQEEQEKEEQEEREQEQEEQGQEEQQEQEHQEEREEEQEEEREKASPDIEERSGERDELCEADELCQASSSIDGVKDEADSPLEQSSNVDIEAIKDTLTSSLYKSHQSQKAAFSKLKKSGDTAIYNSQISEALVGEESKRRYEEEVDVVSLKSPDHEFVVVQDLEKRISASFEVKVPSQETYSEQQDITESQFTSKWKECDHTITLSILQEAERWFLASFRVSTWFSELQEIEQYFTTCLAPRRTCSTQINLQAPVKREEAVIGPINFAKASALTVHWKSIRSSAFTQMQRDYQTPYNSDSSDDERIDEKMFERKRSEAAFGPISSNVVKTEAVILTRSPAPPPPTMPTEAQRKESTSDLPPPLPPRPDYTVPPSSRPSFSPPPPLPPPVVSLPPRQQVPDFTAIPFRNQSYFYSPPPPPLPPPAALPPTVHHSETPHRQQSFGAPVLPSVRQQPAPPAIPLTRLQSPVPPSYPPQQLAFAAPPPPPPLPERQSVPLTAAAPPLGLHHSNSPTWDSAPLVSSGADQRPSSPIASVSNPLLFPAAQQGYSPEPYPPMEMVPSGHSSSFSLSPEPTVAEKSSRIRKSVSTKASKKIELTPAEKEKERIEFVEECMNTLDEAYMTMDSRTIDIVDNKCCNCCLNASLLCYSAAACCSKLCCTSTCCAACRWATSGKKLDDGMKRAARYGFHLSLSFIRSPSRCLLLFWRIFELLFFVLSAALSIVQFLDQKDKKDEQYSVYLLGVITFALSGFDSFISIIDNFIEWRDACKECKSERRERKQRKDDLERNRSRDDEHEDVKKRGGKVVLETMKKILVYALIYPLLICDMLQLFGIPEDEMDDDNKLLDTLDYVLFGIGCFLTLFDVYLHRTFMLIRAARDIEKKREKATQERRSSCCGIHWRLIAHTILIMIAQIFMLVAISFSIVFDNNEENSEGKDLKISSITFFMIACGFVLPIFSLVLFAAVNVFWEKTYFIDLFQAICKKGKNLPDVVDKMSRQKRSWRVERVYDQIKTVNITKEFSFSDKIRFALGDFRIIVLSLIYTSLAAAFVVARSPYNPYTDSSKTNDTNTFYAAAGYGGTSLIADLLTITVAMYWNFVIMALMIIVVMFIVVSCLCSSNQRTDNNRYR